MATFNEQVQALRNLSAAKPEDFKFSEKFQAVSGYMELLHVLDTTINSKQRVFVKINKATNDFVISRCGADQNDEVLTTCSTVEEVEAFFNPASIAEVAETVKAVEVSNDEQSVNDTTADTDTDTDTEAVVFEVSHAKAAVPATYKQYEYLQSLGAAIHFRSTSQFLKCVDQATVSDAITAAKRGKHVIIRQS